MHLKYQQSSCEKREVEELETLVASLQSQIKESRDRLEDIKTAQSLLEEDMESGKEKLQEQYILQNTAKMNLDRATEQKNERRNSFAGLHADGRQRSRATCRA